MKKSRFLLLALALMLPALSLAPVHEASAAYAPDWQAGNIIGDAIFFDSGSLSEAQIQQFLISQVPNCDTNGTQPSGYGGTRAQYAATKGYSPPFVCLKDYYENPSTLANNLGGTIPSGAWSAAHIIANAAVAYGVSPKAILVTLQKESSLVTDSWPFPSQYRTAMGYGCPDTAPCDAQYYGFYNQVTNAARQFQRYASTPTSYRYRAGQNNAIQYNPNASCGSSTVYVQNQATAGLYNYTPYQPNSAALNNLYGTGDGCSAYGNRNFWRMYTDWFGSPMGSDLVRTVNDATVYLVSGPNRYPIADSNVLADFGTLGNVLFVSDAYINAHTARPTLGHMVGGDDGTLYFINAGIKLPFGSCDAVASYGYSCNTINRLTNAQLNQFASGPYVSSLYKTTSGKLFHISGGTKREVFDQQSLTSAGISDSINVLLERGITYLPYGNPVIRDGVMVTSRNSGGSYLYDAGSYWPVNDSLKQSAVFRSLGSGAFDGASFPSAAIKSPLTGFISNSTTGDKYAILGNGKAPLGSPAAWTAAYTPISSAVVGAMQTSNSPLNNMVVKSPDNGTVYYVSAGTKRPISAWEDLLSLQLNPLVVNVLYDSEINAMPNGTSFYGLTSLVKVSSSGTVYVVDGVNHLYPITSFLYPQEVGIQNKVRTMSDGDFSAYQVAATTLQTRLKCGNSFYIGSNGQLFGLSPQQMSQYGFNTNDFYDVGNLCGNLTVNSAVLGNFIRTPDGTIYLVSNGRKQAYTSFAAYTAAGGTSGNTINVSNYFASLITSGPNITQ